MEGVHCSFRFKIVLAGAKSEILDEVHFLVFHRSESENNHSNNWDQSRAPPRDSPLHGFHHCKHSAPTAEWLTGSLVYTIGRTNNDRSQLGTWRHSKRVLRIRWTSLIDSLKLHMRNATLTEGRACYMASRRDRLHSVNVHVRLLHFLKWKWKQQKNGFWRPLGIYCQFPH